MDTEIFQRHTITLESSGAASGEASEWARELARGAGLPDERLYALDLCIVELVTNIVLHAYRSGPGKIQLELELYVEPGAAVLAIIDAGPVFDPLSVPARPVATTLEEASIGGYGIRLVRSTADGCRYERRGGRNVFTAWFGTGGSGRRLPS